MSRNNSHIPSCRAVRSAKSAVPRATVQANKPAISEAADQVASTAADQSAAGAELSAWLARYEPVEREIMEARERRLARAAERGSELSRAFGDLCEATEGQAVDWRRRGLTRQQMEALAEGDVWTLQCLARYFRLYSTSCIDLLRHAVKRPLYYAAENARRRALAAERRKVSRRRTSNPCPSREAVLEAWIHRRDSHEAAVRFGSLIEDLECYLDSSLIRDDSGEICGRRGGVKRWLQTEIPALYSLYTTVMRYKAMARRLRQIVGVKDPTPVAVVVDEKRDYGADEITVLKAKAIWLEVTAGVRGSVTALMERIDALLDPELVEEANMLAEWRRKYDDEITVRTKSRWWQKFSQRTA